MPQRGVADLLSASPLDVRQRPAGTGGGFQFVVGEVRRHGVNSAGRAAARPCSAGGRSGLDALRTRLFGGAIL